MTRCPFCGSAAAHEADCIEAQIEQAERDTIAREERVDEPQTDRAVRRRQLDERRREIEAATRQRVATRDSAIIASLTRAPKRTIGIADDLAGIPGCDLHTLRLFALPTLAEQGRIRFNRDALCWTVA